MTYINQYIDLDEYKKLIKSQNLLLEDIYNSVEWINLIQSSFSVEIKIIGTVNHNGKIISALPIYVKKNAFFNLYGSPLSGLHTHYSGPVFTAKISHQEKINIIVSQVSYVLSQKINYFEIGFNPYSFSNIENFESYFQNLKSEDKITSILNLNKGEEKLWNSLESRARNMIRKSKKLNVEIKKIVPNQLWVDQYYEMLVSTYKRQKQNIPHRKIFYENLCRFINKDKLICYSAKKDNEIIANAIFIIDHKTKLFLSGTSNKLGMKFAANSLIQWISIQDAINEKLENYDLGGLGNKNIDKFKNSFNGSQINNKRFKYESSILKIVMPIAKRLYKLNLLKL